ncbi:MAG: helix-turn-helix transcriptional regulator [Mobilitalea sp.]
MVVDRRYEMSDRIRECRKQKNLSQAELAEIVSVSNNTISNMETGNNVKLESIEKVADFFEVSLDYLVKGTGQAPLDDTFVNRYLQLSAEDKKKMLSVMNIFFPESA